MPNVPKQVDRKLREIRKIAKSIEQDLYNHNEENNMDRKRNLGPTVNFIRNTDESIKMYRLDYEE